MRKNSETARFPQSAALFKFCLRVMEVRAGARVHDQEVGNILSYNPSDTSHWKRGKKAVRSIYALDALASALDVSSEVIQDLADGAIDLDDAWYEFEESEELRRVNARLTPELLVERRQRLAHIERYASDLLRRAGVLTIPVFLPEVLHILPSISLVQGEVAEKIARSSKGKPGTFLIRYRKGDLKAHTRAAIAREIARILLFSDREAFGMGPWREELEFLEVVDLSNCLLAPKIHLVRETESLSTRVDVVKALAEVFWVPKSVVRCRLKQVAIESLSEADLARPPLEIRTLAGAARSRSTLSSTAEATGQSHGGDTSAPPPESDMTALN